MIRYLLIGLLLEPICTEAGDLTGNQVLKNVVAVFDGVQDFTASVDITIDVEGLRVPPMHAKLYYKRPDKTHLEAQGFAMLPREGIGLSFVKLLQQFTVDVLDRDTLSGKTEYRLHMRPRDDRNKYRSLLLYVDREQWTPDLFILTSLDSRVTKGRIMYERNDRFLLPEVVTITLASVGVDSADALPAVPDLVVPRRQNLRMGTITVRYSDYKLNTGLQDDIFEAEKQGSHE